MNPAFPLDVARYDTVIRGGTVVWPHGRQLADVGIRNGTVAYVGELTGAEATETIDATGCMVLPGVIDPHVHLSVMPSPGHDEEQMDLIRRDMPTESLAAAFGGVTTFLPMINLTGSYLPYLDQIRAAIEESSYVDAGMTAIVSSREHVAEIPEMAAFGVSGFKHFLNAYRRDQAIGSLIPVDEGTFFESLHAIAAVGPPALAMIHAEDADLIEAFESRVKAEVGEQADLRALSRARPPACEITRVEFAAAAAQSIGAQVYFCHCTSFDGTLTLERLAAQGAPVASEAVTHCLTHNCDTAWSEVGVWGKFSPPIRGERDRRALWASLRRGTIQHVASDHCTWTRAEKENGAGQRGSTWVAMPGIASGMEHLLPALITYGIRTGEMTWEQLVANTSYNTAARFGYLPRKGDIRPGADADILVVDPEAGEVVGPDYYHGRGNDWSLYWEQTLYGRPKITMVRGRVVQRDGALVGAPGEAEYVRAG